MGPQGLGSTLEELKFTKLVDESFCPQKGHHGRQFPQCFSVKTVIGRQEL